MTPLLIDIGSSTTKIGQPSSDGLFEMLDRRSIYLKRSLNPETGLGITEQEQLYTYLQEITDKYSDREIHVYGTSVFRKLSQEHLQEFRDKLQTDFNLEFQLISHDDETQLIAGGLMHAVTLDEPVMISNIGGGSTEILVVRGPEILDSYSFETGVGDLLRQYPKINDEPAEIGFTDLAGKLREYLKPLSHTSRINFATGGELHFTQIADYPLKPNELFVDSAHPSVIDTQAYQKYCHYIYHEKTVADLEQLMPENPTWMQGARPYLALACAINSYYNIETMIPSDINLLDGIVRTRFA